MHVPYLVALCGYPCSGKTTLATYIESELKFARADWDHLTRESSLPTEVCVADGGLDAVVAHGSQDNYDFRDEAWRRLIKERDTFLPQGRDVVIDAPVNDCFSRERVYTVPLEVQKVLIAIDIRPGLHRKLLQKRSNTEITDDAMAFIYDLYEISLPRDEGIRVLSYRNWFHWDMWRIKRSLKKELRR